MLSIGSISSSVTMTSSEYRDFPADARLGLETAIVSPSFTDGLRTLSLSLGFFAGGSEDAVELDLTFDAGGGSESVAWAAFPDEPIPASVAGLHVRIWAVEAFEVK